MNITIDLDELVVQNIQDTPEGMARARALLTKAFSGIDLEAVAAIREALAEEGKGVSIEEAFASAENAVKERKKVA
jgi:hypothetical protein